jgi:hypothetical protein
LAILNSTLLISIIKLRGFISFLAVISVFNFAKYSFKILYTLVLIRVSPYSLTYTKILIIAVTLLMPLYPLITIPLDSALRSANL